MKLRAPTVLGLSIGLPLTLYAWRLRTRAAQELLAAAGIAVGVALVFGVLIANTSIAGSARGLVHQLIGTAQLQLEARSENGFDERLLLTVRQLPGVQVVSPLLRENLTIVGPQGSKQIQLIGVTERQLSLGPAATRELGSSATTLINGGVGLPASVAKQIGAQPGQSVTLRVNGKLRSIKVRAVLGSQTVGAVASSPVAFAPLRTAQSVTDREGRVTNALVRAAPGAQKNVEAELRKLAAHGANMNVTSADNDLRLLNTAAKPNQQSTTLFAAIAGMVGFLLALNAMLLTIPERRRFVAELRSFGYDPGQIVMLLAVQALALGIIGSALGIVLGYVLSHTLFSQVPSYLAVTFPVGEQKIVTAPIVAIAISCGVLAAVLASARPLLDLRPGRTIDTIMHEQGEAGQSLPKKVTNGLALGGSILVMLVTVLALSAPSVTIVGGVLLAIAAACIVPFAYTLVIGALSRISEHSKGVLPTATVELQATATRSIAVAAIAALAVYGSLAIGGARSDLTHGIASAIEQDSDTAQIWVTTGDNVFNTVSFQAGRMPARIAAAPGVAAVRADQGALLDVGDRRLLIRTHSPTAPTVIQSTQLVSGNFAQASALIRRGGWATVSQSFALERNLKIGDSFTLPTPSGSLPLRVAAITSNLGWPAGAITFSTVDYVHGWQTTNPSALEINLQPGVTLAAGKRAVLSALGPRSGLHVQTVLEREAQANDDLRQGLSALGQISTLLLITGALAVAASLGAAIWQRRTRLAAMKTWGYDHLRLWRSLLVEATILLSIGCVDGALLGVYGHALADRWLRLTTDFPAPFAIGGEQIALTLALVVCIALVVIAVPGFAAASVPPDVSFQE